MAKDRYRYFRIEAREILDALSRGILELERSPGDRALVARLLRQAHTLKGAARVVQQQTIGDLAHAVEDALEPHREEGSPPASREHVDALLRAVDEIAAGVAALDPAPRAPEGAPERPGEDPFESVRIDVREMDALLAAVLEAGVQATTLRRQLARLDHVEEVARALGDHLSARRGGDAVISAPRARALVGELRRSLADVRRALATHAGHAESEIAEVRNSADRLRLLPARAVFATLERAARDAARALEREVTFETGGGDVRVDAGVLSAVRDALLHAVRNAVAHGVEPAAERVQAGKPAAGAIRVEVTRRGRRVVFSCSDDGRGVDAARVREAAVAKGLVSPEEAAGLEGEALATLLLRGGVSTAASVSAVAGRGVGLDVVRDTAARLDAQVSMRSEPGLGTTVEIAVPVSVAALTALHVEVGGAAAAVPLDAVRGTAFVRPEQVVRMPEGPGLEHEGEVIPFVPLAQVLRRPAPAARRFWSAVVVQAGARRVALGADRLTGTSEIVVRPLPRFVEAAQAVAGATLDAEGNPQLVLDPAGLLAVAAAAAAGAGAEAAPPERLPILVVDDSLTTRMLEQSILESAGYEVELAVSGEDALEKARARRFGLYLVDVEMPGMDGFELVRRTRAEPALAAPAILVTSRAAPEDRRRGREAGASAYFVKSEFDQRRMLATIEELLE